jgi:glutamine synthetase
LKEIVQKHKRIAFNGNNYTEDWVKEAQKRGLPNISSTVAAIPALISAKAVALFSKHGVFSESELHSRYEIFLEIYNKQINIEALTMIDMAKREIMPAAIKYAEVVANSLNAIKAAAPKANVDVQAELLEELSAAIADFNSKIKLLEKANTEAKKLHDDSFAQGEFYRDVVFKAMAELRAVGEKMEEMIGAEYWPLPTYAEMLFVL